MFLRIAHLLLLLGAFIPLHSHAQAGDFNLEDWPKTRVELKPLYVKAIMEQAGVHKVTFELPADFYAKQLDTFTAFATEKKYRVYLKTSVAQNLATIAVVHCDWNNGVPHYEFAQNYLGAQQLELLKQVYPDAIAKLQNNCE